MRSTKAETLAAWAERTGRAFVRFDYSGHGESEGRFEDGTISRWLDDSLEVIQRTTRERPILVGSSMGGWISLLAAKCLAEQGKDAPAGMVLIAPAVDFTERLIWDQFTDDMKRSLVETGSYPRPSEYTSAPYAITLRIDRGWTPPSLVRCTDPDRMSGSHPAGHGGPGRTLDPCHAAG